VNSGAVPVGLLAEEKLKNKNAKGLKIEASRRFKKFSHTQFAMTTQPRFEPKMDYLNSTSELLNSKQKENAIFAISAKTISFKKATEKCKREQYSNQVKGQLEVHTDPPTEQQSHLKCKSIQYSSLIYYN